MTDDERNDVKKPKAVLESEAAVIAKPDTDLDLDDVAATSEKAKSELAALRLEDDYWQPIETAPDGVMLLFADMMATAARHWAFCGWRHSGMRCDSVQMPDNTSRSATHWRRLPAPPQSA